MKKLLMLLVLIPTLLTGCATIVGDKTQTIAINSNPPGATFKIQDESAKIVQQGVTPSNVTLEKHNGGYFGKKTYTITFSKPGYKDSIYPLKTTANGWYVGGNLIFGGLIGYLVVDPLNGGMYKITPEKVEQTLEQ
jgi:hypothetical protein